MMTYEEKLKFHLTDKNGKPTGVFDLKIFEHIKQTQHLFICGGNPYIYRNGYYNFDLGGVILKTLIRDHIIDTFVKSNTITRVYNLFFQDETLQKDFEEIYSNYPHYMINFKNCMYDARNGKIYKHTWKCLCINQIPHNYTPDEDHGNGDAIEEYLNFSVPDPEDREMLLQYIGLCCTMDTSQQKMLILCGSGGTGKSTLINLVQEIVGYKNTSNVALSDLEQRFSSISLMGKTLNSCADLEIDALEQTCTIKKLIGEDAIKGEYKGKDCISFKNYSKLLFSTNELPLVKNEKTNGFYRRLLVLTMNQQPKKKNTNLSLQLQKQLPYLLHLSMQALMRMYQNGTILNSQNSLNAIEQLNKDSDTVEAFIKDKCVKKEDARGERTELYEVYNKYCEAEERQSHTKNRFYKALRSKGFGESIINGKRFFRGIELGFMEISEEDIPFT